MFVQSNIVFPIKPFSIATSAFQKSEIEYPKLTYTPEYINMPNPAINNRNIAVISLPVLVSF